MSSFFRLRPTLFDKLVYGSEIATFSGEDDLPQVSREEFKNFAATNVENFTEASLRATIRRDLAWLLNTTSFETGRDLTAYPNVKTSTLNYGVREFAGRTRDTVSPREQAREIRDAIKAFEPRLDPKTLRVKPVEGHGDDGRAVFVIEAEITGMPNLSPVRFQTQLERDSASIEVVE